jgi:hypothetical protein
MARLARVVVTNCPHHVIQRANRRQKTFSELIYMVSPDLPKSKNKIECKYAIPAGAALGQWNIEVTNPAVDDDGEGTLEAAKSSNTDKTFDVTD